MERRERARGKQVASLSQMSGRARGSHRIPGLPFHGITSDATWQPTRRAGRGLVEPSFFRNAAIFHQLSRGCTLMAIGNAVGPSQASRPSRRISVSLQTRTPSALFLSSVLAVRREKVAHACIPGCMVRKESSDVVLCEAGGCARTCTRSRAWPGLSMTDWAEDAEGGQEEIQTRLESLQRLERPCMHTA